MSRRHYIVTLAVLALAAMPALTAQESAFTATNQDMAVLPGGAVNLSVVDGDLYCYASGVLLKAQRSGQQLLGFWADTEYVKLNEGVNYVTRHPSGDIYFTSLDKKGNSRLFCRHVNADGKGKVKKVKMSGMTVEHPTFTTDGKVMIFSSLDKRHSRGGYDLWYSILIGGKWSKPINLGNRINTDGDETSPSIYRDCLLFASNGQQESDGLFCIYSSRLLSEPVQDDTVSMLQIGRCRVQKLPEAINDADGNDFDMIFDTLRGCAYWVSDRKDGEDDSQIYSFTGELDGVQLWGRVMDILDNRLEGVRVTALQGGIPICSTVSDVDGFYHLYLKGNQYYDLSFQLADYFIDYEQVNTAKEDADYLISDARQDVKLDKLQLDQQIHYSDIYGPNADVELSEYGMEQLEPLLQFLLDNPEMSVTMTLKSDLTENENFNRMFTAQRLQTLQNLLYRTVPSSVDVTLINGCMTGCNNAIGGSRLTVVITKD